jgi:hypothetical protein
MYMVNCLTISFDYVKRSICPLGVRRLLWENLRALFLTLITSCYGRIKKCYFITKIYSAINDHIIFKVGLRFKEAQNIFWSFGRFRKLSGCYQFSHACQNDASGDRSVVLTQTGSTDGRGAAEGGRRLAIYAFYYRTNSLLSFKKARLSDKMSARKI